MPRGEPDRPGHPRLLASLTGLLAAAAMAAAPAAVHAAERSAVYRFVQLPSLGGPHARATGIDTEGRIVGWSLDANGASTPVTWIAGHPVALGDHGSATGINDAGVVSGDSGMGGGGAARWDRQGYHYLGGDRGNCINRHGLIGGNDNGSAAVFDLDGPHHIGAVDGSFYEDVNALDDRGNAVGYASRWDGASVRGIAAWWDAGVIGGRELPGLSAMCTAHGVNRTGLVVGHCETPDHFIALRWDAGVPTALPAASAAALAVNARGDIVGWASATPGAPAHAARWTASGLVDLDAYDDPALAAAGWSLSFASAVNRRGWIVGEMMNASTGETSGFLLVPR